MEQTGLDIGIIGAGSFAVFAATAFVQVEGIHIVAVTDINKPAAENMAKLFNAVVYDTIDEFLGDNNIALVYIATPPSLHYEQSKKALLAGRHVICEKPAALKSCEAEELQSIAKSKDLLYVVNLMQRYNPLYKIVAAIIKEKLLGDVLHGFFENYASDENLREDHWFWDEEKSGGIFIEHGVHFFDMFSGWLGDGKVISAAQMQRKTGAKQIIDRMQATVLYNDVLVNFYHGFDQPKLLDRQQLRLQFERGDITLYGWVPVEMKLNALLQKEQLNKITQMLDSFSTVSQNEYTGENQSVRGRFKDILFDEYVTIDYGSTENKMNCYQQIVKAMLADQWQWIKMQAHKREIDDNNAIDSLKIAEEATSVAKAKYN